MSRMIFTLALFSAAAMPITGHAQSPLTLKSVSIDLPDRGIMFSGPGYDVVNNNCLACHSAGMVLNQPALGPGLVNGARGRRFEAPRPGRLKPKR
jgi:hypothetical protein